MATPEKNEGMDKDTKEILEEMQAEGIDTASLTGETDEAEDGDGKVTDPELEESAEETDEEEEEESTDDDESDDDEDEEEESTESDEAEDADGEEDEEEEPADGKSKPKLTLVQKYRKEKKLRKETQATLEALQLANGDKAFDSELKAFADKNNLSIEVARGLVDFAARKAQLPKEVLDDIKRSRTERRDQEYWGDQHKKFDKDFSSNVKPALEGLGLDDAKIQEIKRTLNDDSASPVWAWDKKNKDKSLVQLALEVVRKSGGKSNRVSSEGSSSRSLNRGKQGKEISDMTPEDLEDMSDEEFDKFSDKLAKGSKSVVHRS